MIATVLDTETTGLIENPARKLVTQPEIISLAAQKVELETGKLFHTYYRIFKPTTPISKLITEITGFRNEDLQECDPIYFYLDEIILLLEAAPLIIGQNIRFDIDMVDIECKRYNKTIKWPAIIDLVQNTIHLKGYRLSLTNLHMELFGNEFESAHRADIDATITAKCAVELYKRGLL